MPKTWLKNLKTTHFWCFVNIFSYLCREKREYHLSKSEKNYHYGKKNTVHQSRDCTLRTRQ